MPVDAIIRASFQSVVTANQAVNSALVGHPQNATGPRAFEKVGTASYSCSNADDVTVAQSLVDLAAAVATHSIALDFLQVTIARRT